MIGVATVGIALITAAIWWQIHALDRELATQQGDTILSLQLVFLPGNATQMVNGWRHAELIHAARKCIHWDWAFIVAYFVLMRSVGKWIILVNNDSSAQWAENWLVRLPAVIVGLDVIENFGIYILLGLKHPEGFLFSVVTPFVGILAALKFIFVFFFVVVSWRAMRVNLRVLFLPRFSLLMLAIGVILIFVPQWQEALIAAAEESGFWVSFWLGITTLIASIATWYSARVLYTIKTEFPKIERSDSNDTPDRFYSIKRDLGQIFKRPDSTSAAATAEKNTAAALKKWYPRALGLLVPFIIILGYCISLDLDFRFILRLPLLFLFLAWILCAGFVLFRRPIARFLYDKLSTERIRAKKGYINTVLSILKIEEARDEFAIYDKLFDKKRPGITKGIFLSLLLLNVAAFCSVWYNPLWVQGAGSAAVVIGAIGLMVPLGNGLVYFGERKGLPMLLLLFGLAGLFSFHNDNHWVRLAPDSSSADSLQAFAKSSETKGVYADLHRYAKAWAATREEAKDPGADIPMFIVSTEGGGIRAAYWTAIVLAHLQDLDEGFASHLFAASGVSGGSLGATVFAAQVAVGLPDRSGCFLNHADSVLQRDFLSPTIATLLFPDLMQRFLPWAIFDDRALALENSWENAWEETWVNGQDGQYDVQRALFKSPFDRMWPKDDKDATKVWVPLLFLNSTVVETGNRLIMHPLAYGNTGRENASTGSIETFSDIFKDAIDGRAALGSSVPASTAAHLSARFTFVSPAGSAHNGKSSNMGPNIRNAPWIRLVDGGYFENSATITAGELLKAVKRFQAKAPPNHPITRLKPFMIHISNEPIHDPLHIAKKQRGKQSPFGEILSPFLALLNTRPARGFQARDELFSLMGKDAAHFCLFDLGTTLPLGWALSSNARLNMRGQLDPGLSAEMCASKEKSPLKTPEAYGFKKWVEEAKMHNRLETEKVLAHLRSS